jgi:hypothetical protein
MMVMVRRVARLPFRELQCVGAGEFQLPRLGSNETFCVLQYPRHEERHIRAA